MEEERKADFLSVFNGKDDLSPMKVEKLLFKQFYGCVHLIVHLFVAGNAFDEFQNGRILLVQIESPKGLAAMESMIAEYGEYIDGFIVGPNDYSIVMGIPRQLDHPLMLEEYKKFYAICKKTTNKQ